MSTYAAHLRGLPRLERGSLTAYVFARLTFFGLSTGRGGARRTARAGGSRQRRGARKAGRSFSRTPPRRSGAETQRGTGQQERRARPPPRAFAADCAARPKRGGGRALRRRRPKRRRALASTAAPRHAPRTAGAAQRRGTEAPASARRAAVRTANGGKQHNGAERTHLQARAPGRARPPIQAAGGAAAPRAGVSRAAISKRGWAGRTSN